MKAAFPDFNKDKFFLTLAFHAEVSLERLFATHRL